MSRETIFNRTGLYSIVGLVVVYFAAIGWRGIEAGAKEGQRVPGLVERIDRLEKKVDLLVEAAVRNGSVTKAEAATADNP